MKLWEKIFEENKDSTYLVTEEELHDSLKKFAETGKCDDMLCSMCPFFCTIECSCEMRDSWYVEQLNRERG